MIIKDKISSNRVLESSEESLTYNLPVITRYLWKLGVESKSVQLIIDEGNGSSYTIELDGDLFLKFGLKRCLNCGDIIDRTSKETTCEACKETIYYKYRRCLFEGPGTPFESVCTPENPPCKVDWMRSKCWSDHYLYLGRIGNKVKVGISNCKRKEGKFYRIIEQGLDEALVLSKFKSLQEVLSMEVKIAEMLNLTTYFTFMDKINLLTNQQDDAHTECNLHEYLSKLEPLFPDITFSFIDLTDVWQKFPTNHTIKEVTFPQKIEGTVVTAQGNILFVRPFDIPSSQNVLNAYNLSRLVGYEIFTNEESLYEIERGI